MIQPSIIFDGLSEISQTIGSLKEHKVNKMRNKLQLNFIEVENLTAMSREEY